MPTARRTPGPAPTIEQLMADYASATRGRGRNHVEESLDLLRHGLNGYAYRHLSRADAERFHAVYNDGDEGAFCRMFGASYVVRYLDEFLGDFLIRKVIMPEEVVAQTIEDLRGFVEWLAKTGAITPATARRSLGRVAAAAVDLPAAERLSQLLYALAKRTSERAAAAKTAYDDMVDDYLVVQRVARRRIWFLDGVGPIDVPEAASALARPGWTINLVLGRRGGEWDVLEVGNVYPETLA